MTKVDYFLLCENVVVDKTDKVSLINIYDAIYTLALPAAHPKFAFTFRVQPDVKYKKASELTFRLVITYPSGEKAVEAKGVAEVDLKVIKQKPQIASSIDLSGFPLSQEGEYKADLFMEDELIATRPFKIEIQKELKP